MSIYNFVSFLGIFVLAFIAWLSSSDKKIVNWRAVLGIPPSDIMPVAKILGERAVA